MLSNRSYSKGVPDYADANRYIYVDFDGTLCEFKYPALGEPREGAQGFMQALIALGLKPVVWSSRMSPAFYSEEARSEAAIRIGHWLVTHEIPCAGVDAGNSGKPLAFAYVDDKAVNVNPQSFEAALGQIKGMLYVRDRGKTLTEDGNET